MSHWAVFLALLAGCATEDEPERCEVDCPEPPAVLQHVEDLRQTRILVTAYATQPEKFATTTLRFDYSYVAAPKLPGCPVLDREHPLSISLTGVPGRIKTGGGAFKGARWQCGDIQLEFTPMSNAPAATILISDETGELSFDLGDALVQRSVEAVDNPDWTFVEGEPAVFRWSPASDVETPTNIRVGWDGTYSSLPIMYYDAGKFSVPLPPGNGTALHLVEPRQRACGENCMLTTAWSLFHAATLIPSP